MFCPSCGKEVPEGAGFCPSCGAKIQESSSTGLKSKFQKVTDTVTNSAKSVGERVNEATDGRAGQFAQTAQAKAKETARNFSADIKQATQDKDAKGFFTKNKYRNTKIIAGIVVILIILGSLFGGGHIGSGNIKSRITKYVEENYPEGNRIESVKYLRERDGKDYYIVRMTYVPVNNDNGVLIAVENGEIKVISNGKYSEVMGYYKDIIDR